ncbi:uncharacterized protein VNE69_03208 [Vairimorpha necatrix]|uniref:Uncharacterized protein n=1 Tax=Vairimorpha necatrix TaxID=6039 RepID=A0AAX4JAL8_9MICR
MFLYFFLLKCSNNIFNTTIIEHLPNYNQIDSNTSLDFDTIMAEGYDENEETEFVEDIMDYYEKNYGPAMEKNKYQENKKTSEEMQIQNLVNYLKNDENFSQNTTYQTNEELMQEVSRDIAEIWEREEIYYQDSSTFQCNNKFKQKNAVEPIISDENPIYKSNLTNNKSYLNNNYQQLFYDECKENHTNEKDNDASLDKKLSEMKNKFCEIHKKEQDYMLQNPIPIRDYNFDSFCAKEEINNLRNYIDSFKYRYREKMMKRTTSIKEQIEKKSFFGNGVIIDALEFIKEINEYIICKTTKLYIKHDILQVIHNLKLLIWKIYEITNAINVPDLIESIYGIYCNKLEIKKGKKNKVAKDITLLKRSFIKFYDTGKTELNNRVKAVCGCATKNSQ